MAAQDTTEEDSKDLSENEEIETSENEEDETTDEDNESESTEESEDSDEENDSEDEDDSETEDEDEPFEKRFTQFKGESYEEYTPQLEKAYGEALAEMTRLKQSAKDSTSQIDMIRQAASQDADFAKKLDDVLEGKAEAVTVDPALLQARQDMEERMDKEYKEFIDLHPEMESNPQIAEQVLETLTEFGKQSRAKGKIMGMGEALRKAWAFHGFGDDTKEKTIAKAKESASKSKTGNKAKKVTTTKDKYTAEQRSYAKKWGITLAD